RYLCAIFGFRLVDFPYRLGVAIVANRCTEGSFIPLKRYNGDGWWAVVCGANYAVLKLCLNH
ncbi:MAG: hypothetical protein QW429_02585, partial [Thermoprotei archaeon]